ncbi:hypothetical protein [Blastococcus sp. TF02A-30]|uniref:hypothetical protein n=1 Tax=Blastococcus sp. TF02A-30 TaxID=2250580 RepID=UPI000DEA0FC7|nr:hypothetical protein [Blastococcus sp. TF02A-30]RBY89614.1 hypothetical protein DQ241_09275 [Blastococcus sp. TF02A-30]
MATSVLDVRDTFAPPRASVPARPVAVATTAPRRLPVAVLAAGGIGVLQAVALLAVGLTELDTLMAAQSSGAVVGLALLVLAGWIVTSAGGGAALLDGSGRRLLQGVAVAELAGLVLVGLVAVVVPLPVPTTLSLPALLLLAVALPVGKLLLVGSPSASAWIAAGPRARPRVADPVAENRGLATATLGAIGLVLVAVALLAPVDDAQIAGETAATTVYQP